MTSVAVKNTGSTNITVDGVPVKPTYSKSKTLGDDSMTPEQREGIRDTIELGLDEGVTEGHAQVRNLGPGGIKVGGGRDLINGHTEDVRLSSNAKITIGPVLAGGPAGKPTRIGLEPEGGQVSDQERLNTREDEEERLQREEDNRRQRALRQEETGPAGRPVSEQVGKAPRTPKPTA